MPEFGIVMLSGLLPVVFVEVVTRVGSPDL